MSRCAQRSMHEDLGWAAFGRVAESVATATFCKSLVMAKGVLLLGGLYVLMVEAICALNACKCASEECFRTTRGPRLWLARLARNVARTARWSDLVSIS
eukprot:5243496-Amphidinium_carterae.1